MLFHEAPFKYLCTDSGQYGLNTAAENYAQDGVRLLRTSDLHPGGGFSEDGIFIQGLIDDRFLVQTGDVLLTRSGSIGQSFQVPEELAGSAFAGFLIRYRPNPAMSDPRFVSYVTRSRPFQAVVGSEAVSSTISNFNADRYARIQVPLPPLEEQRRIADFLDDQVARIDSMRSLREVEQRGFGLALEGYVEEGILTSSTFAPLGRMASLRVSNVDKHIVDGQIPVRLCNYVDVYRNSRISKVAEFDSGTATSDQLRRFSLEQGDVVFTKDSETSDDIGIPAYVDLAPHSTVLGYHCCLARPISIDGSYLYWALTSRYVRQQFAVLATGVTRLGLKMDALKTVRLPVAQRLLQSGLANDFWQMAEQVDALSMLGNKSLRNLEERKRAVITAAVTGELDVTTARPIGVGKLVPNVGASIDSAAAAQAQAPSIGGIG